MNEDELALRDQLRRRGGTDAFGVPTVLMGIHDEGFFQILGRIVALSALVEMRLVTLYELLTPLPERRTSVRGTGDLFAHCKQQLGRLPEADAGFIETFLDSAAAALKTRHGYAHSLWPAQGGEEQFAWRPDVRKDLSQTITFTKTTAEMRADLDAVVRILDSAHWNRVIRVAQGYEMQPEELAP